MIGLERDKLVTIGKSWLNTTTVKQVDKEEVEQPFVFLRYDNVLAYM
jgi:hypothetical protein